MEKKTQKTQSPKNNDLYVAEVRNLDAASERYLSWASDKTGIISRPFFYSRFEVIQFMRGFFHIFPREKWVSCQSTHNYPSHTGTWYRKIFSDGSTIEIPDTVTIDTGRLLFEFDCSIAEEQSRIDADILVHGPLEALDDFEKKMMTFLATQEGIRGKTLDLLKTDIRNKITLPNDALYLDEHTWDCLKEGCLSFFDSVKFYKKLGVPHKRGIIAYGPPGSGKTTIGRYLESHFTEVTTIWSDLRSVSIGYTMAVARKYSPCLVIFEDVDVVGVTRQATIGNTTLWEFLNEIDGRKENEGILLYATTNRAEDLDSALLRTGRFDVHIDVHKPDLDVAKTYLKDILKKMDIKVKAEDLYDNIKGKTCSDIKEAVEAAALRAAFNKEAVSKEHFQERKRFRSLGGKTAGFNSDKEA